MAKGSKKRKQHEQERILNAQMIGAGVAIFLFIICMLIFLVVMNTDGRIFLQDFISSLEIE